MLIDFSFISNNGVSGELFETNSDDDSMDREVLVSVHLLFVSLEPLRHELIVCH